MANIVWAEFVLDLLEELPLSDAHLIVEKTKQLGHFPRMYPYDRKADLAATVGCWLVVGLSIIYLSRGGRNRVHSHLMACSDSLEPEPQFLFGSAGLQPRPKPN